MVTAPIPDAALYRGAAPEVLDLTSFFNDPDTTAVRLTTVLGDIDLGLYDQQTPITVANFLRYINEGRYFPIDPTTNEPAPQFVHRSVPGFVIQSGGFVATVNPADPAHILAIQVLAFDAIQNEPGISNTRGTIAMAKVEGDPNSATSQWFINLADNGGPPNDLDTQNGGFTVFGRVSAAGMTRGRRDRRAADLRREQHLRRAFRRNCPLRNFTFRHLTTPRQFRAHHGAGHQHHRVRSTFMADKRSS